MKISQTYRADSAPREPKSTLRGLVQPVGLTLLACMLAIGAIEAQQAAPPISGVIGKVQSFTGRSLDVQTPSGVVHVDAKQPLTTYKQIPSDLSHVASASYVGVASTEQADGKEVAKQIFIFPAELSGAAEGSVLTDPQGATTHSRMTNGSVQRGIEGKVLPSSLHREPPYKGNGYRCTGSRGSRGCAGRCLRAGKVS